MCQFLLPVELVHEGLCLDGVHVAEALELAHRDVAAPVLVDGLKWREYNYYRFTDMYVHQQSRKL